MSSPPVVRLSHALYSDAPFPRRAVPTAPLSPICSGKQSRREQVLDRSSPRQSELLASTRSTPTKSTVASSSGAAEAATVGAPPAGVVRLLLPRAFAVADRAYHTRYRVEGSSTIPATRTTSIGVHRNQDEIVDCPCRRPELGAPEAQQLFEAGKRSSREISASQSRDDINDIHGGNCSRSARVSQARSHDRQLEEGRKVSQANGQRARMVIVESVLGFSTVRSLLEQSHGAAHATSRDEQSSGYDSEHVPFSSVQVDCPPPDEVQEGRGQSSGERGQQCRNVSTSEAIGRLVGWLRLAIAASDSTKESSNGRDHLIAGSVDVSEMLSSSAMDTNGEGWACDRAQYEVTGRCDAGLEWSGFTLEPAAGMEKKGSRLERGSEMRVGDPRGSTLEIRLVCHPLITMVPDLRWCLRLMSQAKGIASLLNANAKLSTLGGGYFLTRQVGQAIRLARAQSEVAAALGDLQLAGKCRVNEAYNYIWLGRYAEAHRILHNQFLASRAAHDEELENIAVIASRFLRRSITANRRLLQNQIESAKGGAGDNDIGHGSEEWVRQRIDVKTDEWHRVRALPMYRTKSDFASPSLEGVRDRGQLELLGR